MQDISGEVRRKKQAILSRVKAEIKDVTENHEIKAFIAEHDMNDYQIERSISKFHEYLDWKNRNDGYEPVLVLNEGFADVRYKLTGEALKAQERAKNAKFEAYNILSDDTIKDASFDNFNCKNTDEMRACDFAQEVASYYMRGESGNTIFSGKPGTGKSHLAMSILKKVQEEEKNCRFVSFSELLGIVKESFDSESKEQWAIKLCQAPYLLVLDDVGSEKKTDWTEEFLTKLLNGRTRTIITTNLSSQQLRNKYNTGDGRTYSRLLRGVGLNVDERVYNFENMKDKRVWGI